jgi:hypothetical protein
MFARQKINSTLDAEIIAALTELEKNRDNPEEYAKTLDRVGQLDKLKPRSEREQINWNTVVIVAANIFGILYLARWEPEHYVKAPNAFKFIIRPKTVA